MAEAPGFGPSDERRHEPSTDPAWVEAWSLDLVQPDLSRGASFELLFLGAERVAAFHASVVGPDQRLVTLSEIEAAIPAPPGLELRAPGLWAEIGIQTPLEHATVDIEAFAVRLDDPGEVFGRAYGERVALGSELEWETGGPLERCNGDAGYEIPCTVHGVILLADEVIEIDGWGWRSHRWGSSDAHRSTALRGRRATGDWWRVTEDDGAELQTIARDPIADLGGILGARHQRLVRNTAGDAAWLRSP